MIVVQILLIPVLLMLGHQQGEMMAKEMNYDSTQISLIFSNTLNNLPINSDATYTNIFEESFSVRSLKYYISHIKFTDSLHDEIEIFDHQYFLINESDEKSKTIELNTALKHISSISFLVGVDSLKNVSGVQTGVLDPARGMFWTWNTGYVYFKFEGNASVAKTPGRVFSYHIGGYKPGENASRWVKLTVPAVQQNSQTFKIEVALDKFFHSVNPIKIAALPLCHEPGKLAMKMADNYQQIFSISTNNFIR